MVLTQLYSYPILACITVHICFIALWIYLYRKMRARRYSEMEIAERKQAQKVLQENEEVLRALHEITSVPYTDLNHKVRDLLATGCRKFGMTYGILARISKGGEYEIVECVPPNNLIKKGLILSIENTYCCETLRGNDPIAFEHASVSQWRTHPAFHLMMIQSYIGIRLTVNNEIYGTLNFVSITPREIQFTKTDTEIIKLMAQWVEGELHRKQALAELEENQNRLKMIMETEPEWVSLLSIDGILLESNPAGLNMVGAEESAHILNKSIYTIISPDSWQAFSDMMEQVFQGNARVLEFDILTLKGRFARLEIHAVPLRNAQKDIVALLGITRDVTERKLAEDRERQHRAELAHVGRFCTMGEMASSLAHELNQPLTAISNYTRGCVIRLRSDGANSKELTDIMERVAEQAERAGEIIRRLREFIRKREPQKSVVDTNSIVQEAVKLLVIESRNNNVSIISDSAEHLPPVMADAIQIEQVFLNLLRNGIEAIEAANHDLTNERELHITTTRNDAGEIEVSVRDTGIGISATVMQELFKPFFSTKPNGMGMGLSISRSIIEAHGGRLWAMSNQEHGTTFCFTLPTS